MTVALRNFDEPHLVEEMDQLQDYLTDYLNRVVSASSLSVDEDGDTYFEYESFPKYLCIGKEKNPELVQLRDTYYIFFNDAVLVEGIRIQFVNCNDKDIQGVISRITKLAKLAVEMVFRTYAIDQERVFTPDYSRCDH